MSCVGWGEWWAREGRDGHQNLHGNIDLTQYYHYKDEEMEAQ